jgi:hypothetical protein
MQTLTNFRSSNFLYSVVKLSIFLLFATTISVVSTPPAVALTCAQGGPCALGDTGPGGGIVFYYRASGFSCGQDFTDTCHYLEAAPAGWFATIASGTSADPFLVWSNHTPRMFVTSASSPYISANADMSSSMIGLGYKITHAQVTQDNQYYSFSGSTGFQYTTAPNSVRAYRGGSKSDWYLPVPAELNQLCKYAKGQTWTSDATLCSASGTPSMGLGISGYYTGLSAVTGADPNRYKVHAQNFGTGIWTQSDKDGNYAATRPIRAFTLPSVASSTDLSTSSTTPIFGQTVTLSATIKSSGATATGALGTVDFKNNGTSITGCSASSISNGVAQCSYIPASAATYSNLTAAYSGGPGYYSSNSSSISITVSKATPTFTWADVSKLVGSGNFSITAPTPSTPGTFIYSSGTTSVISLSGTTATIGIAGTSLITATFTPSDTTNYNLGATTIMTVTVGKATPTFSNFLSVLKPYGATNFDLAVPTSSTTGTWTYSSGTSSVISLSGISAAVVGFGTSVITATFTPDDATNYVSGGTIAMTVTVSKAPLTITASSHTVAFGDAIPSISPIYGGFVNGEDSSVLLTVPSCSTIYTTTTSVGKAGASCSGAAAINYSFAYTAGEITISQGGQTSALTIDSTSVTYGSTLSLTTLGGNGSGANSFVVNSGPCSVSGSTLSTSAAGTCMVTATKAANGNYLASSSVSTAITVTKKNLTISGLTGINKVFDGDLASTVTGTPSLVGVVGSDNVALTGTPTFAFATADVANTKALTGSGYGLTNSTASNYTLTQPVVIANVTQKAARVIATSVTIASGASVTSSFITSGLVIGDSVTAVTYSYSGTGTTSAPTAVGVYTITPSLAVFGTGTIGNYSITYDDAVLTILAKYTTTYNANGGVVSGGATASVDFVVGENALSLPTATRANYTFIGWFTSETSGTQVTGAYTPTATAILWSHWVQNSLYGMGANTKILTITTLSGVGNTYSADAAGGTIAIKYLADALAAGTVIDAYVLSDTSTATTLIGAENDYVMSLVLAWTHPITGLVETTATGKPITMTITNSVIKKGAKIYSVVGVITTLLTTATTDGIAVISITDDPQIIIAITAPDAPAGVTATTGGSKSSTVSWIVPSTDGGSAITYYTATSNLGQFCTSGSTSCSVTGLSDATTYTFTVTATNAVGVSIASAPSAAILTEDTAGLALATQQAATALAAQQAVTALAAQQAATALAAQQAATALAAQQAATALAAQQAATALAAQQAATALAAQQAATALAAQQAATALAAQQAATALAAQQAATALAAQQAATALAAEKAAAEKLAADEKAVAEKAAADAKAAAELKATQDRIAAEAAQAAAIKAAQELADVKAKEAAELKAAQDKAAEELRIAEELRAAQAKADADLKAAAEKKAAADAAAAALLAAKKITPKVSVYSVSSTLKLSAYDNAYLKKYVSQLAPNAKVTCVGYIYSKNTTYAKAKALAQSQAKAVCSLMKAQKKTITTTILLYPASKAPKPAAGSKWVTVSYRVDSFKK